MKFSKTSFYPKIFLLWKGILLSSTHTPSVQHIGSTQGPHLFSTRNPSVPHQNPLSSTPKTPQNWRVCWTEECVELRAFCVKLRGVWNWRVFGVELWNFWCWTERFLVWNWGRWIWGVCGVDLRAVWNWRVFGVEPRGFWCGSERFLVWNSGISGAEKEWLFCVELLRWTEGGLELRGTRRHRINWDTNFRFNYSG